MAPQSALESHRNRFGAPGVAYQAPGRVNLIGEHTDTSEGYVMPVALDLRTISVLSPRRDSNANIYSVNFAEQVSLDLQHLPSRSRGHWSDYPASVLWTLAQQGVHPGGFDLTLSGNVPLGSGLSSSASVEVAVAVAVLDHAEIEFSKPEIAKVCQYSENNFVGAQSGIMDPFTSCCGVANHALLIDCRSLDYEVLPLPSEVWLVICNSMVKHSLAGGGEYNARRAEVLAGVRVLQQHDSQVRTLRDVTEDELRRCANEMSEEIFRRCLHVITENARVLQAAKSLQSGDFPGFGRIMHEAHISMRDNYAASCVETDLLVELALQQPGCFGARITGGGFGGCTINLVDANHADNFVRSLRAGYEEATGIRAEIYLSRASAGAGPLV